MDKNFLSEEYMQQKAEQLLNNQDVKKYLEENNKSFDFKYGDYESAGIIDHDTYLLMMQLGIPIGISSYVDGTGKEVSADDLDFDLDADHSDCKYIYTPINNFDELNEYMETHRFMDFMGNPKLITPEQERHMAYLLEHADDKYLFDRYTMNKMQNELIDSAPLKYDVAMNIFKKYYTKNVCNKFIYDYGVGKEQFYYLSGLRDNELKKENHNKTNKNMEER